MNDETPKPRESNSNGRLVGAPSYAFAHYNGPNPGDRLTCPCGCLRSFTVDISSLKQVYYSDACKEKAARARQKKRNALRATNRAAARGSA